MSEIKKVFYLTQETKDFIKANADSMSYVYEEDDNVYFLPMGFRVTPRGEWIAIDAKDLPATIKIAFDNRLKGKTND